jgi:hypothetical protein
MSWWETSTGALVGDRPADALGNALTSIQHLPGPLALGDLLRSFEEALKANPDLVANGGTGGVRVATAPDDDPGGAPRAAVTRRLAQALQTASDAYAERWQRRPTLDEVAENLAFVLRPTPRPWLTKGDDARIDDVVVQHEGTTS